MDKDIDRIPKNAETDIIIRVDDFGGKRGVTIMEFVRSERYTGFTKAGTRIPVEHFIAFREAINSIKYEELMEGIESLVPTSVKGVVPAAPVKSAVPTIPVAPVKSVVPIKAPVSNKESPKSKVVKPAVKVEENFEDSSEAEI